MASAVLQAGAIAPTPILTQLQAIFDRDASADCIALVWPEPFDSQTIEVVINNYEVCLVHCSSELAMREALVNHDGAVRLVLLSKFDEIQLAKDVLARLWRNEPQRISPWKTLQQLINVSEIDPRLNKPKSRWIADSMLSSFDRYHQKLDFGDVLDLENAWRALAIAYLDYQEVTVDLPSLFKWAISHNASDLVSDLPADLKANLSEWLHPSCPQFSGLLETLFEEKHADDLLAIGLACSVMFSKTVEQSKLVDLQTLFSGRGLFFGRFLSGKKEHEKHLAEFGAEAERTALKLLRDGLFKELSGSLGKAEQILASLDFSNAYEISNILPASFNQRLGNYAAALELAFKSKEVVGAEHTLAALQSHALSSQPAQRTQIDRAKMALRLLRWLVKPEAEGLSVNGILANYISEGGFVDWARSQIWAGDIHESLSKVYQTLTDKAREKRESQNRVFSHELIRIARGDQLAPEFIPVENAIEKIVAPIAQLKPVLFLVLDGMSQAVYRELLRDLLNHNWIELTDSSVSANQHKCLVAALPTVTEVSRCSLLSGVLSQGLAADEKKAFSQHPLLKKIASTKFPPVLLHKQDIQQPGSGALAGDARALIAGTEHRVLAAVINAIDDQLASSSQVSVDWTLETVTLFKQVLEAARESGRVVVITSDHGHVLDHNSQYQNTQSERGERYQLDAAQLSDNEVKVAGDRVVTATKSVILPWTEQLRYTKTKNMGYHGGGSLQEVVIPLGVFVSITDRDELNGWAEIPRYLPDWWSEDLSLIAEVAKPLPTPIVKKTVKAKLTEAVSEKIKDLFDVGATDVRINSGSVEWLDKLFVSAVYEQAKQRAGRSAIKDEQLKPILELLIQNNSQVMEAVLLRHLSIPKVRLPGIMSGAQRLLNIDGYPILSFERDSQTIKLKVDDLKKQFEL